MDNIEDKMNRIDQMSGSEFETFCVNLLSSIGFENVEQTKGSGDHGVDILAHKYGYKYVIQCKRYSDSVGNRAIQEIYSGKDIYHADRALVVTNSSFTTQAMSDAISLNVELWNRDTIKQIIIKNDISNNCRETLRGNNNTTKDAKNLESITLLTGREARYTNRFYGICARWLLHEGYQDIQIIKSGEDYGVDITAQKDGIRYAIQCINRNHEEADSFRQLSERASYYGCERLMAISDFTFGTVFQSRAAEFGIELKTIKR